MISNRQLHLQYLAPTNPFPLLLEVDRAEGVFLFSPKGKKYYDLISGISVSNLGHNDQRVIKAAREQLESHMHIMVYGEFVQGPQVKYAQNLVDHLPQKFDSVYFVNSGAESAEGALKLAKRASGRPEIAYFKNSYHGSTAGALSVMGDEQFKQPFRPLVPGTFQLRYNNIQDIEHISTNTAAVIMETVQAESGVTVPDVEFMKAIRKKCDQTGTLLILDEIQCGMGRTGELFSFQHFGIEPDIILLAKALGGGMPLGAFICNKHLMDQLSTDPMLGHITTFGGHPVSCAAGNKAFEILTGEKLYISARKKSDLIAEKIQSKHVLNINRIGLLMAVEFESFEKNKAVIDRCLINGVITDWFLFNNRSLRIAPPLIISKDEIEESCEIINTSIREALD